MTLDSLPVDVRARIVRVDAAQLVQAEARRLEALGIEAGAEVTVDYRGVFGGADPLAVRVGRMVVAVRRAHAVALEVEPLEGSLP